MYASCFDANAGCHIPMNHKRSPRYLILSHVLKGIFEALLTAEDAVISDELNHASIIDGVRLCKARRERYQHRNMDELEAALVRTQDARARLIVTDGVFSMDGNVAPLADVRALADKYGATLLVDECHATGFFGKTGIAHALLQYG